jgi:DDE superfamily endonuclease
MNNRSIEYWVIPPESDAEFVASMEDVLETYEKPYDPMHPVLCMDEQPVQLIKDVLAPIDETVEHARRVDYEYERAGTANIFMFTEPLAGWREAFARETKTKTDWALAVAELLEGRYAQCESIILVCDNLNTHTRGAFYEIFEPSRARALVKRIEWCYTPKHGSWLNIAENELSSLTRQCLNGRRLGEIDLLRSETTAWHQASNDKQRGVDWHFKIDNARHKLKSLYPKILM